MTRTRRSACCCTTKRQRTIFERTIKNLKVSSQELSDDLEAVQHSFLLKGFFKKKKKDGD